jgi:hypothetical protein
MRSPSIASFVVGNIAGVLADRLIARGWTMTRVSRFFFLFFFRFILWNKLLAPVFQD